ncbi:hypothetical protein LCM02_15350 [Lutimonas saemankumensis]|uniref:hypothetical protein n=1 Tax=Lutimonas saemankumensis TaxID=483016 RepID=UPI001CD26A41|nr:hypothetical protein [Lutimonas saemankumensis]MCA0933836.1 hypothetical protein [Lutimonas saemankumensis]
MKKNKLPLLVLTALILFAGCGKEKKINTPTTAEIEPNHQWTEKNIKEFEKNCVGFLESEGVDNAKEYCDCLLETSIKAYPDPAVAMELEQNEIVKLFEGSKCMDDLLLIKIEDPWTEEVENLFLKHCKSTQIENGVSASDADEYCACALTEIKEIVPNPHHVMSLTEEELTHVLEKCK